MSLDAYPPLFSHLPPARRQQMCKHTSNLVQLYVSFADLTAAAPDSIEFYPRGARWSTVCGASQGIKFSFVTLAVLVVRQQRRWWYYFAAVDPARARWASLFAEIGAARNNNCLAPPPPPPFAAAADAAVSCHRHCRSPATCGRQGDPCPPPARWYTAQGGGGDKMHTGGGDGSSGGGSSSSSGGGSSRQKYTAQLAVDDDVLYPGESS